MQHAWRGYEAFAWGLDELDPISQSGEASYQMAVRPAPHRTLHHARTTPHPAPHRTLHHTVPCTMHHAPRCTTLHHAAPRCTTLHHAAPRCTAHATPCTIHAAPCAAPCACNTRLHTRSAQLACTTLQPHPATAPCHPHPATRTLPPAPCHRTLPHQHAADDGGLPGHALHPHPNPDPNPKQLTMVDSLDTLFILGLDSEFTRAAAWLGEHLHFGQQERCSAGGMGGRRDGGQRDGGRRAGQKDGGRVLVVAVGRASCGCRLCVRNGCRRTSTSST